jgi:uncharacterized membrane protein YkvA (DUF1232 family)
VAWDVVVGVAVGLLLAWVLLIGALWLAKPDETTLREALRLVPDVVRLVSRLARAPEVPRGVRLGLLVLLAYLASPIDLVPDFVPVLGYADDAVVVALTLRWVVRHAGVEALERYWPGTPEGLDAVRRLTRITRPDGNAA